MFLIKKNENLVMTLHLLTPLQVFNVFRIKLTDCIGIDRKKLVDLSGLVFRALDSTIMQ